MQFLTQKREENKIKLTFTNRRVVLSLRACCCCCCCRSFLALLMLVCRPVVSPFLIFISIRFVFTDAVDYVWFSSEPRQHQLISPATSNQSYDLFLGAQHHMLCNRFFGCALCSRRRRSIATLPWSTLVKQIYHSFRCCFCWCHRPLYDDVITIWDAAMQW